MRTYFFGDIHGNADALEACLKHFDKQKADQAYCLGDLVGWLPFGDRTLNTMRSLAIPSVAGNHDLLIAGLFVDHPDQLDRIQASAYNAGLLSGIPGSGDYLLNLPLLVEKEDFAVVHHSPFNLPAEGEHATIESFHYLDEAALKECLEAWRSFPHRLIVSGHDHVPMIYELKAATDKPRIEDVNIFRPSPSGPLTLHLKAGSRYWVKAGSVGGPYRDGIPMANSVLYDSTLQTVTLSRIPYATERLHRELANHRFCRNLPTLQRYMKLLHQGE